MSWRDARSAVLVAIAALALVASFHDGSDPPATEPPPDIRITAPGASDVLVHEPSFEIGGDFIGSATEITVAIDGIDVGAATRGQEPFDWRFDASRFSITPGIHVISATATGVGGSSPPDELVVWYEPDPTVAFRLELFPDAARYEASGDDLADDLEDPRLALFGPGDDTIDLDLTVAAPQPFDTEVAPRLGTGADTTVRIRFTSEPPPGTYAIVVRGVSDTGESHEATHSITIAGSPPSTEPPPATDLPPTIEPPPNTGTTATTRTLFDDFEGPDLWAATVTGATNGAQATGERASGGNPGGHRRMTHVLPPSDDGENNPTQIAVLHLYAGGGWDASVDGPLARIDYAEDQIEYDPPFDGAAIGTRFAIVQDGITYLAVTNENNAFSNTDWQTVRVTGLTAADFTPAPGPDFSVAGGPMTFGVLRSNTSRNEVNGLTTQHGLDNWTVELIGATD